ncbi:MAG: nuclear transport factor 2 family protein [Pseudomonadota bacterium]
MLKSFHLGSLLLAWSAAACAQAPQPPEPDTTRTTIEALDADIFAAAFLTCDEQRLREILSPDLEFYHDLYGKIAGSVDEFLEGTIPDCLMRQRGESPFIRRALRLETMEIRPIGDWGLLQSGTHDFYGQDEDGNDILLETGVFMHVWQNTEQDWRITRVISYDHQSASTP